jgi:hypothetical protein
MSGAHSTPDQYDTWLISAFGQEAQALLARGGEGGNEQPNGAGENDAPMPPSAKGPNGAEPQKPEPVKPGGKRVKLRKLQLEWRSAESSARAQLDAFVKAVLGDPEIKNSPQFADVEKAMAGVTAAMPDFDDALLDALDDVDAATNDNDRNTALKAAMKALDSYRAELDKAETLQELQSIADDDYGGMEFFSGLQAALIALRSELAAA